MELCSAREASNRRGGHLHSAAVRRDQIKLSTQRNEQLMPNLKALGHACFALSSDTHTVLFDPWLSENPEAVIGPDEVEADAILVTHGHSDHLGDAIPIARRLGVPIIAPYELAMYCARFDAPVHPMHIGGGASFDFGHVKLTIAQHGSGIVEDDHIEYTGPPCGFIVTMDGACVYYAGDTGLFLDMELLGDVNSFNAAILPIGDNFTMGPDDAIVATQLLDPLLVVPMHYSAFDVITQDAESFAERVKQHDVDCRVLKPGEELSI